MRPFQAAAQLPLCGQLRAGPEEAENFLVLRCCAYMPYPGTVQADGMLLEEGGWVTEGGREGGTGHQGAGDYRSLHPVG